MFPHPDVTTCLDFLNDIPRNDWYSKILSQIVPGKRVFEVGCGVGILGAMCLQHGAKWYSGIDVRSSRSDITEKVLQDMGFSNVTLYAGDFLTWENPDNYKPDIIITERIGNEFANDLKILKIWQHAKEIFPNCGICVPDTWSISVDVYDGKIDSTFLPYHAPQQLVKDKHLPPGYRHALEKTNLIQPVSRYHDVWSQRYDQKIEIPYFQTDRQSSGRSTLIINDNISFAGDTCQSVSALRDWPPYRLIIPAGPESVQVKWNNGWVVER